LYAEETAQQIDAEIRRILTQAHDKAREILTNNRDKLETVTRRLLEIEVMEGSELRRLLGIDAPPSPSDAQPAEHAATD
jgi:cell division protease FtsH